MNEHKPDYEEELRNNIDAVKDYAGEAVSYADKILNELNAGKLEYADLEDWAYCFEEIRRLSRALYREVRGR